MYYPGHIVVGQNVTAESVCLRASGTNQAKSVSVARRLEQLFEQVANRLSLPTLHAEWCVRKIALQITIFIDTTDIINHTVNPL